MMRARAVIAVMTAAAGAPATARADTGWEVRIPDKLEIAAGATATLPIAIAVDRGLTISRDAGLIVDLAPEAGVIIKRRRLARTEAVDPEADAPRFAVPLRAETAGAHVVTVRVRFWLCGGRVCRPIDQKRSVAVTVTPAPDAPLAP